MSYARFDDALLVARRFEYFLKSGVVFSFREGLWSHWGTSWIRFWASRGAFGSHFGVRKTFRRRLGVDFGPPGSKFGVILGSEIEGISRFGFGVVFFCFWSFFSCSKKIIFEKWHPFQAKRMVLRGRGGSRWSGKFSRASFFHSGKVFGVIGGRLGIDFGPPGGHLGVTLVSEKHFGGVWEAQNRLQDVPQ